MVGKNSTHAIEPCAFSYDDEWKLAKCKCLIETEVQKYRVYENATRIPSIRWVRPPKLCGWLGAHCGALALKICGCRTLYGVFAERLLLF